MKQFCRTFTTNTIYPMSRKITLKKCSNNKYFQINLLEYYIKLHVISSFVIQRMIKKISNIYNLY